jgi:hypothetical protein
MDTGSLLDKYGKSYDRALRTDPQSMLKGQLWHYNCSLLGKHSKRALLLENSGQLGMRLESPRSRQLQRLEHQRRSSARGQMSIQLGIFAEQTWASCRNARLDMVSRSSDLRESIGRRQPQYCKILCLPRKELDRRHLQDKWCKTWHQQHYMRLCCKLEAPKWWKDKKTQPNTAHKQWNFRESNDLGYRPWASWLGLDTGIPEGKHGSYLLLLLHHRSH